MTARSQQAEREESLDTATASTWQTARAPAVGAVLYATAREQPEPDSLWRAQALADRVGLELHMLRVLPEGPRLQNLLGALDAVGSARQVREFLSAARTASAFCATTLGERFEEDHLVLAVGNFIDAVSLHAQELAANVIVVPGGEQSGSTVTALARAARLPVLVVRRALQHQTVIAATDLADQGSTVLRHAGALAHRLQAAVVAVHSVAPRLRAPFRSRSGDDVVLDAHRSKLTALAKRLHVDALVVASVQDPVEAILSEARARGADTVVVGTHARSRFERLIRKSVAAQIVNRARRSVLVTPLGVHDGQTANATRIPS
jgi:nucleotide-binding universal stress UspA family protein